MASAFGYEIAPYESSAFADTGSREAAEARRMQANADAQNHFNFPTFVVLNKVEIPISKYSELQQLKFSNLKQRALNLREIIDSTGSNFFGHYKHLELRATHADAVVAWFIAVQVEICNRLGYQFDHTSFGAPADQVYCAPIASDRRTTTPCWSQHDLDSRAPPRRPSSAYQVEAPFGSLRDLSQSSGRFNSGYEVNYEVNAPYASQRELSQSRRPASGCQVKAPFATGESYSSDVDAAARNRARNQSQERPF